MEEDTPADPEGDKEIWKDEDKQERQYDEMDDSLTDEEFDEAVLMPDTRKSLKGLTPEAAREEVRYG